MNIWTIFEQWLSNQKDREFVSRMDSLAEANLAISRQDMNEFVSNRADTRERLLKMALRFGLSPEQIDAERWRILELTRKCGGCANDKICKRFLDSGGVLKEAAEFCPNVEEYAELARASGNSKTIN